MANEQRNQELLTFLRRTKDGQYVEIPTYAMDYIRVSESVECQLEDENDNFEYTYCC